MGSVLLASLPWRDGLCYTMAQRVAMWCFKLDGVDLSWGQVKLH